MTTRRGPDLEADFTAEVDLMGRCDKHPPGRPGIGRDGHLDADRVGAVIGGEVASCRDGLLNFLSELGQDLFILWGDVQPGVLHAR